MLSSTTRQMLLGGAAFKDYLLADFAWVVSENQAV